MDLQQIDDPGDQRLDDYRNLTDAALRRVDDPVGGLYIAESVAVIARAVAAGHVPRSVMIQRRRVDEMRVVLHGLGVPVYVVSDAVAEKVTGFDVHRGALASMHRPVLGSVSDVIAEAKLVLVLEGIADHANIGAAFRAAAGLGADAVLVSPRCADPLYRRSVRVSMGTVFQVPWTRIEDWQAAMNTLRQAGFDIAALALRDDAETLDAFAADRADRVALLMGSEGEGLSDEALRSADRIVTIPMRKGVDSLNVAAAAAVAVWAVSR